MSYALFVAAALCGAVSSSSVPTDLDDGLCPSSGQCSPPPANGDVSGHYYWPHGKGHPHHYGKSPYTGTFSGFPCNLTASLKWSWQHPEGKYKTMIMGAPVIDGGRNLYLTVLHGILKFGPDGTSLWAWIKPDDWHYYFMNTPALMDGLLYTCSTDAKVYALDMETGQVVWTTQLETTFGISGDDGFLVARDGRVLLDADRNEGLSHRPNIVVCLNGTTGKLIWEFEPDIGVWNFLPMFPQSGGASDGTIVFQSISGSAYRVNVTTGEQLWRAGPPQWQSTFTDGGAALGPNNVLYTVSSLGWQQPSRSDRGGLHAFRAEDGKLLWEHTDLQAGIFTWPVVAQLAEGAKLSVVTGVGSLPSIPVMATLMGSQDFLKQCVAFALAAGVLLRMSFCKSWSGLFGLRTVLILAAWGALGFVLGFAWLEWEILVVNRSASWSYPYHVHSYDAETGQLQWKVQLPTYYWISAAGDEAGLLTRLRATPWRPIMLPCASSYPTVDAKGVIYFSHMDGSIYGIKDWNQDGTIDKDTEVCRFHGGASGFTGGPSIAPGMMAVATTDTLYVFGE